MSRAWAVIGMGRCGLQLARAMRSAGVHLSAAVVRSAGTAARTRRLLPGVPVPDDPARIPSTGGLLIAVPDRDIAALARHLAARLPQLPPIVLHTSGALGATALAAVRGRGSHVGSMHPLVAFPAPDGPLVDLHGVLAAVEGHPAARRAGSELAIALGMRPHVITAADKPRYHAAAALAGNLTHVIVRVAIEELAAAGFSHDAAAQALAPLAVGAVKSALGSPDWSSLTGPLARGDSATVASHLTALSPDVAAAYRALARLAIGRLRTAENTDGNGLDDLLAALTVDT